MNACTHGQPLWHHLAVGDLCPVCRRTIVAVAVADATGHREGVGTEATPQASLECHPLATIATGVAPHRERAGTVLLPCAPPPTPVAAIADPAPTIATSGPALRLPVASPSASSAHGAGSALNASEAGVTVGAEAIRPGNPTTHPGAASMPAGAGASTRKAEEWSDVPHRSPAPALAARLSDPDTSHEAAAAVTDVQRRNVYRAVLEALTEHGPCTDHDLARYVSGKLGHPIGQTSVGVRRGELRNAGLVADSGHKGRTETGAKAIRWALTPAGIDAAGGVAA